MSERCENCGAEQAGAKEASPWSASSGIWYVLGGGIGAVLGLLAYVNYWL